MRGKRRSGPVILLSDDDDAAPPPPAPAASEEDEANADLSMAIIAKAAATSHHHQKPHLLNCIVIDDDDDDDEDAVGDAEDEKIEEEKKLEAGAAAVAAAAAAEEDGSRIGNGLGAVESCAAKRARDSKKKKPKKKKKVKIIEDLEDKLGDSKVEGDILFKLIADDGEDNLEMRKLLRGPRYFDIPENKTDSCREEARKRACFVCGSLDHDVKDCPQGTCFICKLSGHFARVCPNKEIATSRIGEGSNICLRCGEEGHEMSICNRDYHPEDLKAIKCYICNKYGHLCCIDVTLTSTRKDSCYNCGELGHTGVGCAKQRSEEKRRPAPVCYRCGEEGHFARGCSSRGEADFWATSRTPVMENRQTEEFQGFQSVPAKVRGNSCWSDERSNVKQINTPLSSLTDRWNMFEPERGHTYLIDDEEDYNGSSRKRQKRSSINHDPPLGNGWKMFEPERDDEDYDGSTRKRQKKSTINHASQKEYVDYIIELERSSKNNMNKWRRPRYGR